MANIDLNNFTTNFNSAKPVYSEKKLRIGIIGTGGISCSHIPAYLRQPDVELVAACDLTPGKAEGRFKQFKVEGGKFFTDYKEMIDTVEMDGYGGFLNIFILHGLSVNFHYAQRRWYQRCLN